VAPEVVTHLLNTVVCEATQLSVFLRKSRASMENVAIAGAPSGPDRAGAPHDVPQSPMSPDVGAAVQMLAFPSRIVVPSGRRTRAQYQAFLASMDGSFARGLQRKFDTWDAFDTALTEFTQAQYQLFKERTSTSVDQRNKGTKQIDLQIPARFVYYARTYKCVHGMTREPIKMESARKTQKSMPKRRKSKQKTAHKRSVKKSRYSRDIGCTATVSATVQRVRRSADDEDGFGIRWKATGGHNHKTTAALFAYYPEIRLPKNADLYADVDRMLS
jgi:hypothetical protein